MATGKKWSAHDALVYIQTNLNAPKNLFNKFGGYKYRNLEGITDALKPFLKETGCTFKLTDEVVEVGGRVYIRATATLTSPDPDDPKEVAKGWARETETKKGMDDAQITGSTSSYARKYAANGLFCIDDTKDPDDTNKHGKGDKPTPSQSEEKVGDKVGNNDGKGDGKPALSQERFEKMKQALGKDKDKYTPDVKKTLSKVSATEEQIKTLKGMMA